MRTPLSLLILHTIITSCATRDAAQQSISDSSSTANTVAQEALPQNDTTDGPSAINFDSTVFVDFAHTFTETKEFYISLYYKHDIEDDFHHPKPDSVIFEEDGYWRKRLPKSVHRYYKLENIDTLLFFNKNHRFLCKSPLERIEMVEDGISSQVVAVYKIKSDVTLGDGTHYCISSNLSREQQPSFYTEISTDSSINKQILKVLPVATKQFRMRHVKVFPSQTIYSTVSSDAHSFIVETSGNKSKVLHQAENDYRFDDLLPLPIFTHGKPLLLLNWYIPESDGFGDLLAAYNGKGYKPVPYGRITLDMITP